MHCNASGRGRGRTTSSSKDWTVERRGRLEMSRARCTDGAARRSLSQRVEAQMTLEQMQNLLTNRMIVHAARRFPWETISVAPGRRVTENDIQDPAQLVFAIWIAVNIRAWLLRWRGDQYSALLRLWRFNVE